MRFLIVALLIPVAGAFAQKIEEKKIKTHITVLAADDMEGRFSGSEGERKALQYIENKANVKHSNTLKKSLKL